MERGDSSSSLSAATRRNLKMEEQEVGAGWSRAEASEACSGNEKGGDNRPLRGKREGGVGFFFYLGAYFMIQ